MSKTFDLSTLNLSAGTHEITVKARASDYADSPASNAVSYVVAGDTVQVSGTWYFNENLGALQEDNHFEDQMVSFTSNNTAFTSISEEMKALMFGSIEVYFNGTWANQAYRTITFDGTQHVSQDFYEWFTANAAFAFTIKGTTYYAEDGMTWGEWVESEYNTDGYVVDDYGYIRLVGGTGNYSVQDSSTKPVVLSDIIIANETYDYDSHGGGSN